MSGTSQTWLNARRAIWLVFAGGLLVWSAPAVAGSVSDFKDSVKSSSSSGSDDDSDDDDYDSHGGGGYYLDDCWDEEYGAEHCQSAYGQSTSEPSHTNLDWLLGARPGWRMSLGTAPYRGRFNRRNENIIGSERRGFAARGYEIEMSGDYHLHQLTARASGLMTTKLDGGGVDLFVKHTSTRSPGFGLKYLRLHDFGNREWLGLARPTYEPNIAVGEFATWSLNLGWSVMHDRDGVFVHGPSTGMGLEMFPGEPWLMEIRGGVDFVSGVVMPHVRGAVGLFATDRLAVEASAQHMQVAGGLGLSSVGLGVRFYQGW